MLCKLCRNLHIKMRPKCVGVPSEVQLNLETKMTCP